MSGAAPSPSGGHRIIASLLVLSDATAAILLVAVIAGYVAFNAVKLGWLTTGQTTGAGLPLELTFYPMGAGALLMTIFALALFCRRKLSDIAVAVILAL